MRGSFLTFEGVEGSGKSTLLGRMADGLAASGRSIQRFREPGGTRLGEAIRAVVLDAAHARVEPLAELFLMLAARAQLVRECVEPALARGDVVLCDRFMDASVAYQGAARGLGVETVQRLNEVATAGCTPDLTLLVDLDPETGRRRQQGPPDRMEREDLRFHAAVRAAYLDLARAEPRRFEVLDGREGPEALAQRAWTRVSRLLGDLPDRIPSG